MKPRPRPNRDKVERAHKLLAYCNIPATVRATVEDKASWTYHAADNGMERLGLPSTLPTATLDPYLALLDASAGLMRLHATVCWRTFAGRPLLTVETADAVLVFQPRGRP